MIAYKAAQLWSTLPTSYKNFSLLDLFKSKIKNSIVVTGPSTSVELLMMVQAS